jgi:hypothetical protein
MDHNERIDNLIRVRLQRMQVSGDIEPSPDFTSRTMQGVLKLERRHQIKHDLWVLFWALFPVGFREAWVVTRGDYFSISGLPLSTWITRMYTIFMSEIGIAILLGVSIIIFLAYVLRFRRTAPLAAKIA